MNSSESSRWNDDREIFGIIRLGHLKVAVFLIGILIAGFLMTGRVVAEDVAINGSYVIVSDVTAPPLEGKTIPFIQQGDTVHPGDVVDITGVSGWSDSQGEYHLAWYGPYVWEKSPGDLDPKYIITLPGKSRTGTVPSQYTYYLDENIFGPRPGFWYQYISNATSARLGYESAGNLQAFRVSNEVVTATNKSGNVTTKYVNGTYEDRKIAPEPPLPEKHITDYLVARGDPLVINASRVWIFGRLDGIYAHGGYFTASEIGSLDIGSYKIVTHEPGRNGVFEVNYDPKQQMLTSPWKSVLDESVAGSQPLLDMNKFYARIKNTDDIINTYDLEVQIPEIYVDRIDEVAVGSRIPIAYEPGMTLLDVRGYTNSENNTVITAIIDPDKQTVRTLAANTFTTKAERMNPGSMSSYQVYIPINKNQMVNGMHTVKVSTSIGSEMYHDFPVSELPANSFVPNATIRYIGDRNPWVPTPTPEIIVQEKVVPGPTQIVTVTVTPSPEQIHKEGEEVAKVWLIAGAIIVVLLAIIVGLALWLWSVYRRARVLS